MGENMGHSAISLEEKLATFSEHWSPMIILTLHDVGISLGKYYPYKHVGEEPN
jgi:hypothetical protein